VLKTNAFWRTRLTDVRTPLGNTGQAGVTWLSTVGTGLNQCNRGGLMAPGAEENWTLSVQHSPEDVQRYVDNFAELAHDLRA
jgi:hypothetical protein